MRRRVFTLLAVVGLLTGTLALPAPGAIHEIVASHCSGHPNIATVDPPGQIKEGQSLLRALQATGVYDLQFGVSQEGVDGLNFVTGEFGPMPGPVEGTDPLTVFVDNTKPSAKLGDEFIWAFFPVPEFGLSVYIQLYELDHPAFEHCPNLPEEPA